MSRESILIVLGILVILSPWSGLPLAFLVWILPVFGVAIAFIGFTLRARITRAPEPSSPPSQELY